MSKECSTLASSCTLFWSPHPLPQRSNYYGIYDCLLPSRNMRFSVFIPSLPHCCWGLCIFSVTAHFGSSSRLTSIQDSISINDETKTDRKTKHIVCSPKLSTVDTLSMLCASRQCICCRQNCRARMQTIIGWNASECAWCAWTVSMRVEERRVHQV